MWQTEPFSQQLDSVERVLATTNDLEDKLYIQGRRKTVDILEENTAAERLVVHTFTPFIDLLQPLPVFRKGRGPGGYTKSKTVPAHIAHKYTC